MSDFGFQVYTPDGRHAISSLQNSYYIIAEGTAQLINPNTYNLRTATIVMPTQLLPNQVPLLLLKCTNKAEVGCYSVNMSGSTVVSWTVMGSRADVQITEFDYAIAVAENGIVTNDKYGLQISDAGGGVLYDSRREKYLVYKGTGGIGAGYFGEGGFNVAAEYEYFTAPMASKTVWVNGYLGLTCFRGVTPTSVYAVSYVLVRTGIIGTGGSPAVNMLFFSKV